MLPALDVAATQRRTLRLLFTTQVIGGIGVAIGFSVGALLAADQVGVGASGLAQSSAVIGGALLAIPATGIVRTRGRRPSLTALYLVAALGGLLVVAAAMSGAVWLLFMGYFLFGGGTTAGLQARYAAIDLAPAEVRGRHLSIVVWATTLGAVTGPNLAPLAGSLLGPLGVPVLAAPFFFSGVLFALAALVLAVLLRPDPIVVARATTPRGPTPAPAGQSAIPAGIAAIPSTGLEEEPPADGSTAPPQTVAAGKLGIRAAFGVILADPAARLGVASTAVGHLVMVGVMSMTSVHILGAGHEAGHTLRLVGTVLSIHIAGMFAFAPITGWLTDRAGRRPVIFGGVALLLLACALAGTAGHDTARLAAALMVLGLGWSAATVAGATLLNDSVDPEIRPSAQGASDLTMGVAAASAGALAGVVMQTSGYPTLAALAALATLPLLLLALRTRLDH